MDMGPGAVPCTLPQEVLRLRPFVLCFNNSSFFFKLFTTGVGSTITMHVWKSEDSYQESCRFFHHEGSGMGLRSSGYKCLYLLSHPDTWLVLVLPACYLSLPRDGVTDVYGHAWLRLVIL